MWLEPVLLPRLLCALRGAEVGVDGPAVLLRRLRREDDEVAVGVGWAPEAVGARRLWWPPLLLVWLWLWLWWDVVLEPPLPVPLLLLFADVLFPISLVCVAYAVVACVSACAYVATDMQVRRRAVELL